MDPTANLNEQRALWTLLESQPERQRPDRVARLVELGQALDEWIINGGFLPDQWKDRRA